MRRTIRLFVSSTFSDMKAERDVLQSDVFPRLRHLCLSNDLRFQAIDLRWGVPEEAGKDNRTMRICLRELRRCQEGHPKPNFLIILGNRYGWQPLPELIPANLFLQLRDHLSAAMQELIEWRDTQPADAKGWYRRDDNAVPPVYELRPRGDDERWHETVEQPLLHGLEAAARAIGLDVGSQVVAIGTSATEQEIVEGALKVEDAQDHVHAFFRIISGLPRDPWPKEFVDVTHDGTCDSVAAARLDALKTRIKARVGETNVHQYTVPWQEDRVQPSHLIEFAKDVYAALSQVILQQIEELTSTSREAREELAHRTFGEERCRGFIGRAEPLEQIAEHLREGTGRMIAVLGAAGSGKSAVIAETVRRARKTYGDEAVLARFIGATPDSANLLSLLGDLVAEIRRRYPAPPPAPGEQSQDGEIPVDINPLTLAFHEALSRPTAKRPLFVFLDAVDQLGPGNGALKCRWLPGALTPHVRLILSAALPAVARPISDEAAARDPFLSDEEPRAVVMAALERRASEVRQIRLQPLSGADGQALSAQWLADAGRTLQPTQSEAILKSFAPEGSPLWLRIAISESQRLASCNSAPNCDPGLPGLLRQVLNRLSAEQEHGAVILEHALAAIASARHGLAEDEVIDVLSANKTVMEDFYSRSPTESRKPEAERIKALPVAVWVRLHGDIAPYLTEHQLQNAALLGFYHRSFLEAVRAAFLSTAERQRAAHQRLADFFGARTWFVAPVDDEGRVQRAAALTDPPNARKASELPWHMLRAAIASDPARQQPAAWDAPVTVLCDIEFVEAKCRAGLVFELQEDYRDARSVLPESQTILQEEKRRTDRITVWTDEIVRYSRAWSERRDRIARGERVDETEPVLPVPPAACRMWTDEEIEAESRRIREKPTRLDRLDAFAGFVEGECYPLLQFAGRAGFALQHAINYAPGGPVHNAARGLLPRCGAPLLLRRWPEDATWDPKPARLRTLEGHSDWVTDVCVTPDGQRAVSGDGRTLRVWDLESGACLRTLEGHSDKVASVSVTPDGRRAVSGDGRTLRVWDLESGACLRTLEGHSDKVASVSVTPDGRRAVSGSADKILRVWDLESGACLRTLGHSGENICVTADGRRAVSAGHDKTLRVWDLESGTCLRVLEGHSDMVMNVSVTPDGRRAVSGSTDKTLRVWDLETGACLRILADDSGGVWGESVSVTADGRLAVSWSLGSTLRVWDLESGTCLRTLEGVFWISTVSVTVLGQRAVSASLNVLELWNLESGASPHTPEFRMPIRNISVTPGERLAVSGSLEKMLRVWDVESGACLRTLEGHSDTVTSVSMTPDGRRAVSGSHDKTLRVWDLESGACLRVLKGHGSLVQSVSVTPDGRRAVSGSYGGTLRVWDLASGACLHILEGHSDTVWSVYVAPDGWRAASGSSDKTLRVWDLESGACLHILEGHSDAVWSVCVRPDGLRAVSGSDDKSVRVWDLQSGSCLYTLEGHSRAVESVTLTPDGRRTVSQSRDKTPRVWNLENGACLHTLEGHSDRVTSVCVTADGRHAVSASVDKTLRVWDLESGVCRGCVATAPVLAVAILSRLLIIGTAAGQLLLMEMHNLASGPAIAPDTSDAPDRSDAVYEESLRRGLNSSRREKGSTHEKTFAHLAALAFHLERMNKTEEAHSLREEARSLHEECDRRNHEQSTAALQAYQTGDYAQAERSLRSLIASGSEVAANRVYLIRILLMQDRHEEAMTEILATWEHLADAPSYVVPRFLWLQLALLYTTPTEPVREEDSAWTIGLLKTALALEGAHAEWAMDPVLAHLQPRLRPEQFQFLAALVAALNDAANLPGLEQIPAWHDAPPQPLG